MSTIKSKSNPDYVIQPTDRLALVDSKGMVIRGVNPQQISNSLAGMRLSNTSWEDLRFPAQGISLSGITTPPDIDADTGLYLFGGSVDIDSLSILAQMPHAWKEGTDLKPHMHWRKTSNGAGTVIWYMRHCWTDYGELQGAWSNWEQSSAIVEPATSQVSTISTWSDIDGTGHSISAMLICQFIRFASVDTYADDALMYEFDIHYEIDSFGSDELFVK